jgi:hypothetical protein
LLHLGRNTRSNTTHYKVDYIGNGTLTTTKKNHRRNETFIDDTTYISLEESMYPQPTSRSVEQSSDQLPAHFRYIPQQEKLQDVSTKPRLFHRMNSTTDPKTLSASQETDVVLFEPSSALESSRSNGLSFQYRDNRPWTEHFYHPDYWSLYDTDQRYDDLYLTERLWREGRVVKGYYPMSPRWATKSTASKSQILTARPVLPLPVTNRTELLRNSIQSARTRSNKSYLYNPRWSSNYYAGSNRIKFA